MDFSQEQLDLISRYGENLTPPEQVAVLMGVDELEFIDEVTNISSPVRRAYVIGMAKTADALRRQNLEAAMAGSPAAIAESLQQLKQIII